jgi:hypothetical protein
MKIFKYSALLAATALGSVSCNFLDVESYFSETLPVDSMFANQRNLEGYIWNTASRFPDAGAIFGNNFTPGVLATDEGFNIAVNYLGEYRGQDYVLGNITADRPVYSTWDDMYKVIRKANTILARMHEAKDLASFDAIELASYTHMIRGYAYYLILMDYGPVVILGDDVLESNLSPEQYNMSRATYDESVDYICKELELAAHGLPETVNVSEFGRPTRGAALALVARLRLQQASDLYNGGTAANFYFSGWKRTLDGADYVSQTPDPKKWAMAAAAAKRVINMNQYSLHVVAKQKDSPEPPANVSTQPFPYGSGDIDIYRSYSDQFTGESAATKNPEIIWGDLSGGILNYTRHSFDTNTLEGYNQMAVTQQLVDAFYMADGGTIDKPGPYFTYNTSSVGGNGIVFSGYTLRNAVHPMYVNREMRFYATIGFSERLWPCLSATDGNVRNKIITYHNGGGTSGKSSTTGTTSDSYPVTGYVLTKYIHPEDAWKSGRRIPKYFSNIRYAEILLSYVEAANKLDGSYTFVTNDKGQLVEFDPATTQNGEVPAHAITVSRNTADMAFNFNQVRYRVGLPGLTSAELADKDAIQNIIERERRVEFMFENRRYYDVRRWGKYMSTESAPFMGLDIDAALPDFYKTKPINHPWARARVVDRKMVLLPLSRTEVRRASLLDQNPGWAN